MFISCVLFRLRTRPLSSTIHAICAAFGEWKYNYTRVKFDETPTAFFHTDATYTAHHLVFGLGYHF